MVIRTLTVLDPTAKPTRKEFKMAVRPDKLEGKVLGLIWNDKPSGDILLNEFAEQLNKRFHFAQILRHKKADAPLGITEDALNEFSTKCDLVILGVSDWGSCTSWCIHDAVEFEKKGIPTTTICTDEFVALGKAEAQVLGMPYLSTVIVPHPIGGIDHKEVVKKAGDALEDMIKVLTMPREKLSERAKEQL